MIKSLTRKTVTSVLSFFVLTSLFSCHAYANWGGGTARLEAGLFTTVCNDGSTETRYFKIPGTVDKCPAGSNLGVLPVAGANAAVHLAFSDLISGPDTGLGDGQGSGTIVTVWGYGLGDTQDSSTIEYCDSASQCRSGHVYYWKNADGELPSGPANLYESHGMQEIAFSIPDSAQGAGTIRVTVGSVQSTLPFTVRDGNILWVHPTGNNSNTCTYASPCNHVNGNRDSGNAGTTNGLGNGRMSAGDIVYSRGVNEPSFSAGGIDNGMYFRNTTGSEAEQIAVVAYPGTRPTTQADHQGFYAYQTDSIVLSKYRMSVGYVSPEAPPNPGNSILSSEHIRATENGRAVGNHLIQNDGTCVTGWSGAIASGGTGGNNFKAFGNHIDELGCDNSSRFQHTVYMSIRNSSASVTQPWEFGYNYFDSNNVFMGIHFYDETYSGDCGTMTGTMRVHNNVITNQRGAAINIGTNDASNPENTCWAPDIEIYNNVMINVGLGVAADDGVTNSQAIRVVGEMGGANLTIRNNTVYGYSEPSSRDGQPDHLLEISYQFSDPSIIIENNAFYSTFDGDWLVTDETITTTNYNAFYNSATNNADNPPSWLNNILTDPLITQSGSKLLLQTGSPLIDAGATPPTSYDVYGQPRGTSVGAVED